jgi:hypothetical protein
VTIQVYPTWVCDHGSFLLFEEVMFEGSRRAHKDLNWEIHRYGWIESQLEFH